MAEEQSDGADSSGGPAQTYCAGICSGNGGGFIERRSAGRSLASSLIHQAPPRGFAALSALFAVSVALLICGSLFFLSRNELAIAKNFFLAVKAQEAAEAGIQDFIAKLSKRTDFVERARLSTERDGFFAESQPFADQGSYSVYLSVSDERIVLLSIGQYSGVKRQVVAYLHFAAEDNRFSLVRLDNK